MTTEFIDLKVNMTVEQAFEKIKKIGLDKETIYTCYVLDIRREIIGIVTVKDLLLSDRDVLIKDIMEENKHNLINTFMEEAIKRSIHTHEKNI